MQPGAPNRVSGDALDFIVPGFGDDPAGENERYERDDVDRNDRWIEIIEFRAFQPARGFVKCAERRESGTRNEKERVRVLRIYTFGFGNCVKPAAESRQTEGHEHQEEQRGTNRLSLITANGGAKHSNRKREEHVSDT